MVTHRENVVAISDLVIVLDDGQVVEHGTPDQLLGAGGAYDKLWVAEPAVPVAQRSSATGPSLPSASTLESASAFRDTDTPTPVPR
jgi:ABC-type glutathione transport system ATPase component